MNANPARINPNLRIENSGHTVIVTRAGGGFRFRLVYEGVMIAVVDSKAIGRPISQTRERVERGDFLPGSATWEALEKLAVVAEMRGSKGLT